MYNKLKYLKEQADITCSPWSDQSGVGQASINVLYGEMLYGRKSNDSLSRLRKFLS